MPDQVKNWYIASKGKKLGPVSEENLKTYYAQKRINGDTKVIKAGMKAWISLSASGILDPEFDEDDLPPIPQDDIKPAKKSAMGIVTVALGALAVVLIAALVIGIINKRNNAASPSNDGKTQGDTVSSPANDSTSPASASGKESGIDFARPASATPDDDGALSDGASPSGALVSGTLASEADDSSMAISGVSLPSDRDVGAIFGVRGIIESNYEIQSVAVDVFNDMGVSETGASAYPHAYSYDIKALDYDILFGTLTPGEKTYVIEATDKMGTKTLVSHTFWVNYPSGGATGGNSEVGVQFPAQQSVQQPSEEEPTYAIHNFWAIENVSIVDFDPIMGTVKYISICPTCGDSGNGTTTASGFVGNSERSASAVCKNTKCPNWGKTFKVIIGHSVKVS